MPVTAIQSKLCSVLPDSEAEGNEEDLATVAPVKVIKKCNEHAFFCTGLVHGTEGSRHVIGE
jgi:hypothetical protein